MESSGLACFQIFPPTAVNLSVLATSGGKFDAVSKVPTGKPGNCGSGIEGVDVPWRGLCARADKGDHFRYADRDFVLVGRIDGTQAWQVTGP